MVKSISERVNRVLILAGGNLGNREKNMAIACDMFAGFPGLLISRTSALYETPAWGYESPYPFLNQAWIAETHLSPGEVLRLLQDVEVRMGRHREREAVPAQRYNDRTMDLDILLWNEEMYADDRLTIPHPRFTGRYFALRPAVEIAAEWIHPGKNQTIRELYEACESSMRNEV